MKLSKPTQIKSSQKIPEKGTIQSGTYILTAVFALAVAALIIAQGIIFNWGVVDDAYISFRYAENLIQGYGLVFNPGEYVEGYTNFLWTILAAACGAAGLDIVQSGLWLSLFFGLAGVALTGIVSCRVADERGWSSPVILLPPLLLAAYPGWSYFSFSGMEQPFLACLILLFVYFASQSQHRYFSLFLAAAFGLLAALTRWEVVLIWPVGALVIFFCREKSFSQNCYRAATLLGIMTVFFGVYFLWRYAYYGELMPNTYYAKAGNTFIQRMSWGLVYGGELAIQWWIPLSLIVWLRKWNDRYSFAVPAITVIYIAYGIWTGGDHFAWLRFYLPVLPLVAIMLADIVHCALEVTGADKRNAAYRSFLLISVLLIIAGTAFRIDYRSAQTHHHWADWWKKVGKWSETAFPDHYRLALVPAGIIPYYSKHPVLDLMGLTDYETAHFGITNNQEPPGHQKSHIASVLKRKPEVILGMAVPFKKRPTQDELIRRTPREMLRRLYTTPEFQRLYTFQTVKIDDTYTAYYILKQL